MEPARRTLTVTSQKVVSMIFVPVYVKIRKMIKCVRKPACWGLKGTLKTRYTAPSSPATPHKVKSNFKAF